MKRYQVCLLIVVFLITSVMITYAAEESGPAPAIDREEYSDSFILRGATDLKMVSQLTGKKSINKTDKVIVEGTDLGSFFEHNGKVYQLFGDTFGPRPDNAIGAAGQNWRGGTMAIINDNDPRDGLTYESWVMNPANGRAKEMLGGLKKNGQETTKIPTYGFSANGSMYIFYMSVASFDTCVNGEWLVNNSGLARSNDNGMTWTVLENVKWPWDSNFVQASVCKVGDELYFWCIPSGRSGSVKLMKVKEKEAEQFDKYLYFAGMNNNEPQWSSNMNDAVVVVKGPIGEFSVMYDAYLERWILSNSNKVTRTFTITEGLTPWGPWGEQVNILRAYDFGGGIYAPFMYPKYVENNGETIYFTMSRWNDYNVHWLKVRLQKKDELASIIDMNPEKSNIKFLFKDNFENGKLDNWTTITDGGTVQVGKSEDNKNFIQLKKNDEKVLSAARKFDPVKGKFTVDFKTMVDKHTDTKEIALKDSQGKDVWALTFNKEAMEIARTAPGSTVVPSSGILAKVERNQWYHIKAVMNLEEGKCDLYVNGIKMAEKIDMLQQKPTDISSLELRMSEPSEGSLNVADILVY